MTLFFYACVSLDGYLADKNHGLQWLHQIGSIEETSYAAFYDQMDILLMGKKTYDAIKNVEDLASFYGQTKNIVFTHQKGLTHPLFEFVSADILTFVSQLPKDKNTWIVGGNTLVKPLLDAQQIDKIHLQIAPVLLGAGIPLFTQKEGVQQFTLLETKQYGQFAELVLEKLTRAEQENDASVKKICP